MTTATADKPDDGATPEPHAPNTGSLTPEEHARATAARPPEPTPQTFEDNLRKLVMKGVTGDPAKKPSHAEPGSKIAMGPMADELRTLFREMSAEKRHAAIDAAIKAKELDVLQAVLGANYRLIRCA